MQCYSSLVYAYTQNIVFVVAFDLDHGFGLFCYLFFLIDKDHNVMCSLSLFCYDV